MEPEHPFFSLEWPPRAHTARSMRPRLLALALHLALTTFACHSHEAPRSPRTRVLFVGNSYTSVNDLPSHLRALGDAMNDPFDVEAVAPGGATLRMHLANAGVLAKIRDGHFQFVVLQGQSQEPLMQPRDFVDAGKELAAAVQAAGAVPVFYETWARRAGEADYRAAWTGGSPTVMQERLRSRYREVAQASGARVAPVGDALERAETLDGSLTYYAPDGSHPSPLTTCLAAAVLFDTMRSRAALDTPVPAWGLDDREARFVERVAHDLVDPPMR